MGKFIFLIAGALVGAWETTGTFAHAHHPVQARIIVALVVLVPVALLCLWIDRSRKNRKSTKTAAASRPVSGYPYTGRGSRR